MSIIEKAVDKLRGDDASAGKCVPPVDAADGARYRPEDRDSPLPESPPPAAAQVEPRPPETGASDPAALHERPASPETPAPRPPDIEIMALHLEGIMTKDTHRSRQAEEMRMIKRPILQSAFGKKNRPSEHSNLLMITSAIAGEGKTFTSLNLALSIAAEMDRTVLIVDADLAKPGLSKLLKIDDRLGLTDYLRNEEKDIGRLLLRTDIPKLTVLPAGSRHAHSTELLASNRMRQLFHELAVRYPDRIVIFDSPPLLVTSEASVLASVIGQIVLVVESGKTPQHLVKDALAQLSSTENVSLILNKCKKGFLSTQMGSYGYGYGYGYGNEGA